MFRFFQASDPSPSPLSQASQTLASPERHRASSEQEPSEQEPSEQDPSEQDPSELYDPC